MTPEDDGAIYIAGEGAMAERYNWIGWQATIVESADEGPSTMRSGPFRYVLVMLCKHVKWDVDRANARSGRYPVNGIS